MQRLLRQYIQRHMHSSTPPPVHNVASIKRTYRIGLQGASVDAIRAVHTLGTMTGRVFQTLCNHHLYINTYGKERANETANHAIMLTAKTHTL